MHRDTPLVFALTMAPFLLSAGVRAAFWNPSQRHAQHPFQFDGINPIALWFVPQGVLPPMPLLLFWSALFVTGIGVTLLSIARHPRGIWEDVSLLLAILWRIRRAPAHDTPVSTGSVSPAHLSSMLIRRPRFSATVLALTAGLLTYAFASPQERRYDIGTSEDYLSAATLLEREQRNGQTFRWTAPGTLLALPGASHGSVVLSLRLFHDDRRGSASPQLQLYDQHGLNLRFNGAPGWRVYHVLRPPLPLSADGVAAAQVGIASDQYLLVETADAYRVATLDRRLASISYHHKQARHQLPTKDPEVERTMRGIRRAKGMAPNGKAPLLPAQLRQAIDALPDTLLGKRDHALLVIGFADAFRRSELVALTMEDIQTTHEGLMAVGLAK